MFTIVNSDERKIKQSTSIDASKSSAIDNSVLAQEKLSLFDSFLKLTAKNEFLKLQLTLFVLTFVISLISSLVAAFLVNPAFGFSMFIGSIAGIFYLRLLAKSIGNLGKSSSGVSKLQLLLPVCLFIFASKNELIEILPAIIGFFLYKPSLFFIYSRP